MLIKKKKQQLQAWTPNLRTQVAPSYYRHTVALEHHSDH